MAVFSQTAMSIAVDSLEMAGFAEQCELTGSATELEVNNYAGGGWKKIISGLATSRLMVQGWQDYAATGVDPTFPLTGLGGASVQTIGPTGGATVGDPAFISAGRLVEYQPLAGAIGEAARFGFSWAGDGKLIRGQYLYPSGAETASDSGTATAFTTPTASQALYASFHVLSVTGTGTITFAVQTDDNGSFTSATTRITSSAFAAVGKELASLAGALAGETHIRVIWTISGFTSVTFICAAGVY